LLNVVYTCQKSFNFINAFACYKQKCKLVPFNLAHPVYTVYIHSSSPGGSSVGAVWQRCIVVRSMRKSIRKSKIRPPPRIRACKIVTTININFKLGTCDVITMCTSPTNFHIHRGRNVGIGLQPKNCHRLTVWNFIHKFALRDDSFAQFRVVTYIRLILMDQLWSKYRPVLKFNSHSVRRYLVCKESDCFACRSRRHISFSLRWQSRIC